MSTVLQRPEDGEHDFAGPVAELGFADHARLTRSVRAFVGTHQDRVWCSWRMPPGANRRGRTANNLPMARDDAAVIAGSIDEPVAFAAIFERHFGLVYRYCARRIGPEAAEDAAGEVFCRAFEHRHRYDTSRPDAAPWLLGIARNVVADHLRASGRRTDAYARAALFQGRPETNEPDRGRQDELALVAEEVRLLPPAELEPLLLFAWEELSYADIAIALAIPVGTVRSRLNRARRRLRRALQRGDRRRTAPWATTEGSGDG